MTKNKKIDLKTLFVISTLSLAIICGFSLTGFSGLSVTPLLLDFTMDSGSSHSGELTLQNTGAKPLEVVSQVRGFRTSEKGVAKFLSKSAAKEYPFSGEKLLKIKPGKVKLGAGETRKFTYEIRYPKTPEPFGGRYVGALFKASPVKEEKKESEGSSIEVATRVGTLIMMRPSEEILVGEEFKEFVVKPEIKDLSAKLIYDGNRLLVSTLLKNLGNIHIRKDEFSGTIEIKGPEGEVVKNLEISPHIILPGTAYSLDELWRLPEGIKAEKKKKYSIRVLIEVETPYGEVIEAKKARTVEF